VGDEELVTVYRTLVTGGVPERWGYGRARKTDARSNYVDRTTDELVLVYVLGGSGSFTDGAGGRHEVGAGAVLVHWPSSPCSLEVRPDGAWVEQWVAAPASWADAMELLRVVSREQTVMIPGVNDGLSRALARLGATLRGIDDHDASVLGLRLHEFMGEVARLSRARPEERAEIEIVLAACRRLADGLSEPLSMPALAESLGVGYEFFRKTFRRRMGLAPMEYRIHRRVDRARELIVQRGLSNREIADRLGYADAFVFSKQFKRIVGESPQAFRRRMG